MLVTGSFVLFCTLFYRKEKDNDGGSGPSRGGPSGQKAARPDPAGRAQEWGTGVPLARTAVPSRNLPGCSVGGGSGVRCCVQGWGWTGQGCSRAQGGTCPPVPRPSEAEPRVRHRPGNRAHVPGAYPGTLGKASAGHQHLPRSCPQSSRAASGSPSTLHRQGPEPARPRADPARPFPPADPGSHFPFVLRREGCDSSAQLPKVPTARPLRPPPSPQNFVRASRQWNRLKRGSEPTVPGSMQGETHNRGNGSLEGRLRLKILLPELPPHKPILGLVGVPVCDGRGAMCSAEYLSP